MRESNTGPLGTAALHTRLRAGAATPAGAVSMHTHQQKAKTAVPVKGTAAFGNI